MTRLICNIAGAINRAVRRVFPSSDGYVRVAQTPSYPLGTHLKRGLGSALKVVVWLIIHIPHIIIILTLDFISLSIRTGAWVHTSFVHILPSEIDPIGNYTTFYNIPLSELEQEVVVTLVKALIKVIGWLSIGLSFLIIWLMGFMGVGGSFMAGVGACFVLEGFYDSVRK